MTFFNVDNDITLDPILPYLPIVDEELLYECQRLATILIDANIGDYGVPSSTRDKCHSAIERLYNFTGYYIYQGKLQDACVSDFTHIEITAILYSICVENEITASDIHKARI